MERVVHEIETALERRRLRSEVGALRRQLGGRRRSSAAAPPWPSCARRSRGWRRCPSPVLILGESGTGKELVARDLHRLGPQPAGPFVAINCAALPESLVESELFGHERGAFTGAVAHPEGRVRGGGARHALPRRDRRAAAPGPGQAAPRAGGAQVTRLGGTKPIAVDVRVVAATNRDLEAEVAGRPLPRGPLLPAQRPRVRVPPLRDRLSDVPALAELFLTGICARFGMRQKKIAPEALDLLMAYEWRRNNVRELRNAVERMIIAADGEMIAPEHVPAEIRRRARRPAPARSVRDFQELKAEAERRIILSALERHDWHVTRTAEALGLADHASLLKIMRRHNIRRPGKVARPCPGQDAATVCTAHGSYTCPRGTRSRSRTPGLVAVSHCNTTCLPALDVPHWPTACLLLCAGHPERAPRRTPGGADVVPSVSTSRPRRRARPARGRLRRRRAPRHHHHLQLARHRGRRGQRHTVQPAAVAPPVVMPRPRPSPTPTPRPPSPAAATRRRPTSSPATPAPPDNPWGHYMYGLSAWKSGDHEQAIARPSTRRSGWIPITGRACSTRPGCCSRPAVRGRRWSGSSARWPSSRSRARPPSPGPRAQRAEADPGGDRRLPARPRARRS